MFEQRLTGINRRWSDLRWAVSPCRTVVLTLGQRARRASIWFVLGVLVTANAVAWYAHTYPGAVIATDARFEDESARFVVYSLGLKHRGVEVRCLLVVYRTHEAFTVSC